MKKKIKRKISNKKIKRVSAKSFKGARHVMTSKGLIPCTWYNKHLW